MLLLLENQRGRHVHFSVKGKQLYFMRLTHYSKMDTDNLVTLNVLYVLIVERIKKSTQKKPLKHRTGQLQERNATHLRLGFSDERHS